MKTSDIIQSMNLAAVSKRPIASSLLNDIAGALRERDELRAELDAAIYNLKSALSVYPALTHNSAINAERWLMNRESERRSKNEI